jgi:hypothetical protein
MLRNSSWLKWLPVLLAAMVISNVAGAADATGKAAKGGSSGKGYTWADVAKWPDLQGDWTGGGLTGTPGPAPGGGMAGGAQQGAGGAPGMGAGPGGPGSNVPLTAEFKAAAAKAQSKQAGIGDCEPMGVITDSGGSFYFSKDVIIIGGLSDWYNVWRRVYMDGRGHPDDAEPSYFGHSIGWWEGSTLVIDTVAIRGETQIMQGMHIDNTDTHIVERLRLIDQDTMEMKRSITNPEVFTGTWESTKTMKRTDEEYYESYCWTDRDEVLGGNLAL